MVIAQNNTANETNVEISLWNNNLDHHSFYINYVETGYHSIQPKHYPAGALSLQGGATADGTSIWQWVYTGGVGQMWDFMLQ